MAFIPNGSGLWVPENIYRPHNFSVPDGTGYTPTGKRSCLHTGFTTNDDRLIYPLGPWSVSSPGYWTTPPVDASHVAANATVSTWLSSLSAIGDQWCTSAVVNLVEAGGTGAGIGVMCRVNGSGNGYYGMIAKFGGVLRYEAGVFNGTPSAKFVSAAGGLTGITLKVVGNTISMYIGTPSTTLTFISSFNDTGHTTGVPGAIASSGSNGHPDTFQTQTNWLAGEIGGC